MLYIMLGFVSVYVHLRSHDIHLQLCLLLLTDFLVCISSGFCEVLFQTQPLSNLNCNPYIGLGALLLQCNALISISEDFIVKWYHSSQDSLEGPEDISTIETQPAKSILYTTTYDTEFDGRNVTLTESVLIIANLSASDVGQYWCAVSMGETEVREFMPCTKTVLPTAEECEGLPLCPLTTLYDSTPTCAQPQNDCSRKPDVEMPSINTELSGTEGTTATNCTESQPEASGLPAWSYFIFAAIGIAFLTVIVAIATYITAKKTKSLRSGRESPNISSKQDLLDLSKTFTGTNCIKGHFGSKQYMPSQSDS